MEAYTFDEALDKMIGPIGTRERDEFEQKINDELAEYHKRETAKEQLYPTDNKNQN
jgi:hypothetical protein